MPRTKRIQNAPILTLRVDSSGKLTEKSINDFFALFDMEALFGHKDAVKKGEQDSDHTQTSTKE